jgi:hypothetical protein
MSLLVQNLWGEVFRGSAHRVRVVIGNIHFGQAEVSQSEVAGLID